MSELLNGLLQRVSIPANMLVEPAPSPEELHTIVNAALTAPDHGALRPWRFIVFRGEARERLADVYVESAKIANPNLSDAEINAVRQKPLRAPLVVAAVAIVKEHPKVPPHEQIASAAAATQNLQLAANALGYGTIWVTGSFATDAHVKRTLGLNPDDAIVGFVHIGTPGPGSEMAQKKLQNRPQAADFIVDWPAD